MVAVATATRTVPDATPAVLRVASYSRYSSHLQDDGWSIAAQHDAHEREATARRALGTPCEIIWYDELAESAHVERIESRPVFAQMLADAAAGRFDVLWVHKMDRFSRKLPVTTEALQRLGRAGVGFFSLTERFDLTSPAGWLQANLWAVLADYYSQNLGTEIQKGKAARALRGLHGCRVPFGYRWTGSASVSEPDVVQSDDPADTDPAHQLGEWNGLQYLFGLLLAGMTDHEAAQKMNADGRWRLHVPTRQRDAEGNVWTDRPFTRQSVSVIRRNVFYRPFQPGDACGTIRYRDQTHRGRHQAACTWEDWQTMQEIASGRRRGWYQRTGTSRRGSRGAEFRGLAICGECGGRLYIWRTTHEEKDEGNRRGAIRTYERYVCVAADRNVVCAQDRHFARVEDVRTAWCAWLAEHITLPAGWEAQLRAYAMRQSRGDAGALPVGALGGTAEMERRRALEIQTWQTKRDRAIEVYADGLRDKAWRNARVAECDRMLAQLQAESRHSEAHTAHLVDAGHLLTSIADLWPHMTLEERVGAAGRLIEPKGLVLRLTGQGRRYDRWHQKDAAVNDSCGIVEVRLRAPFRELLGAVAQASGSNEEHDNGSNDALPRRR